MPHDTPLISTIAVSLAFAFVGGLAAVRLGLPPLVGYLLAGIAVGPFTPGFVADEALAPQLAEIGVILLMFGVGMHCSVGDLWAVRGIALPGAIGQIASTVVLLRALEARGMLETGDGKIAVGWLIVEDLVMVLILVLLPALAEPLGGAVAMGHEVAVTPVAFRVDAVDT